MCEGHTASERSPLGPFHWVFVSSGWGHQPARPTPNSVVTPVSVPSCPSRRPVLLPTGESPGVIPGIVGAVVVALGGAISSFIAYQKKKLCFKENGEALTATSFLGGLATIYIYIYTKNLKQKRSSGWHETRERWLRVPNMARKPGSDFAASISALPASSPVSLCKLLTVPLWKGFM